MTGRASARSAASRGAAGRRRVEAERRRERFRHPAHPLRLVQRHPLQYPVDEASRSRGRPSRPPPPPPARAWRRAALRHRDGHEGPMRRRLQELAAARAPSARRWRRRPPASASSRRSPPLSSRSMVGGSPASTTQDVGVGLRGQRGDEVLPEGAHARVRRRRGDDEEVARARAGDVQQPPALGVGADLLLGREHVPARRLAALAEADRDRALRPLRDEVDGRAEVVGGVVERDDRRLQPLGLVDREDAHGVGIARPRGGQVRLLARGRGSAPGAGA